MLIKQDIDCQEQNQPTCGELRNDNSQETSPDQPRGSSEFSWRVEGLWIKYQRVQWFIHQGGLVSQHGLKS